MSRTVSGGNFDRLVGLFLLKAFGADGADRPTPAHGQHSGRIRLRPVQRPHAVQHARLCRSRDHRHERQAAQGQADADFGLRQTEGLPVSAADRRQRCEGKRSCRPRHHALTSKTIFLPDMRRRIQSGSGMAPNLATFLVFADATPATRKVPIIVRQSAGSHIPGN